MEQLIVNQRPLPLIHTKLNIPRTRTNGIVRKRLLNQLNGGVTTDGVKLTLIMAPAGYGKTTLAAQWVQQLGRPVAWVSLDESENDLGRFLAYLFNAIGLVNEPLVTEIIGRLTAGYAHNSIDALLTNLLNDISSSPHCLAITLDDYHLINNPRIDDVVNFLLQNAPANLHLIITSRSEPNLPIATLRAHNQLQVITAKELRLSLAECRHFVSTTMGLELPIEQVTQLDEQTEGWVTGLQLATLALQEGVDLAQAFSGSQRYLVDYLGEQVLAGQSAEIHNFLLHTAILKQFNADLCAAVTGIPDCQHILEHLEATHLFLVPLDAERRWYRYHHLFGEFLHGRLTAQCDEVDIQQLHLYAARWYHEQGLASEAVEHALAAGAFGFSAELLQEIARGILMYGEGALLRRWLESLPDELLANNPQLALIYGWTLVRTGDLRSAMSLTETIAPQLDEIVTLRGEWAALRARVAGFKGWTEKNVKFSNKALAHLPADQHGLRSEVAINLGFSHLDQNDLTAARAAFQRAAQPSSPDLWAKMFATFYLGHTHKRQGQLREAMAVFEQGYQEAIDYCRQQKQLSPAIGFMHVGMGEILLEWNRLDEARHHLQTALQMGQRGGDVKMLAYALPALMRLSLAQGNVAEAHRMVDLEEARYDKARPSFWRARLALQTGEHEILRQWETKQEIEVGDSAEKIANNPGNYLTLAIWRTIEGRYAGVVRLFESLLTYATSQKHTNFYLTVLVQKAIALAKMGAMGDAAAAFQRALTLAEPHGYVRLFLDGDAIILMRLLNQAAQGSISAEYAQSLLAQTTDALPDDPLPTPLSPRELEVLNHLASGLSNRQISTQLVVSINTVKAHTRRLYEKLNVNSRSQAVARARELNLLA